MTMMSLPALLRESRGNVADARSGGCFALQVMQDEKKKLFAECR